MTKLAVLNDLIKQYLVDVEDSKSNFKLAKHYDEMGHSASAVSYYLRSAERSNDKILQYSALIGAATCYQREGFRNFTVVSIMRNALLIDLERPEGYFYLAQHHERNARNNSNNSDAAKEWHNCYFYACLGEKFAKRNLPKLYVDIGYPGHYSFIFFRAMSAWWCGLCQESKDTFEMLLKDYGHVMSPEYVQVVKNNLNFFTKPNK